MNTHWKIFNIINLICLTLVISCCSQALFINPQPVNTFRGNFFYSFIIIAIIVVIINCLHNIFLTRLCVDSRRMIFTRQIFFWILLSVFAGIISLFIFYTSLEIYLRFQFTGGYKRSGGLRYFKQFVSISVTGLYIIIAQVILFFRIKRSYQHRLDNSIDEIGN